MKKILYIVAHPYLHRSRANRMIAERIESLASVTVHRLYDLYPYFHVDTRLEKDLLASHDLVVIQHPFYWYSMPPLLKMWLDEVFEMGWAYGPGGDHLKGKDFLVSITTGGTPEAYSQSGIHGHSIDEFLVPWKRTALLCQMHWIRPRILHRAVQSSDAEINAHANALATDIETYAKEGRLA